MPIKAGPNGTTRHYDSRTGRYCSGFSIPQTTKNKKTFAEKEKERIQNLANKAENSKDKNIFEIYSLLEQLRPGSVRHINEVLRDQVSKKDREIDIITDKCVYEIKSGKAKHKVKQFNAQLEFAKGRNKDYVIYSPGSGKHQVDVLKSKGFNVFTSIDDLIKYERKRK